ncbi:MAG: hypothetical protein IJ399_02440 [Bacilli bacterium]|nr:hypothetical protein [Bacilli bacterium]
MKKVLFILLLLPFVVNAKEIVFETNVSYGGSESDYITSSLPTDDGGYIMVGYSDSPQLDGMTNLGYEDAIIVKYDENGTVEWKNIYGGEDDDKFTSVALTQDGGYLAVGETISPNITGMKEFETYSGIMVKYNSIGEVVWQKYWDYEFSDHFNEIIALPEGEFVIVGYTDSFPPTPDSSDYQAVILKIKDDGEIVWQKTFNYSGDDSFESVIATNDNGFVVLGTSDSNDIEGLNSNGETDGIIIKYNENGEIVWKKNWGGNNYENFYNISPTSDSGFVIVGDSFSSNIEGITNEEENNKAVIIKYNKDGEIQWSKSYHGNNNHSFNDVLITPGDNIIVVGTFDSDNIENMPVKGYADALLVLYDKNGNLILEKSFGGLGSDTYNVALFTKNNNLITLGISDSEDIVSDENVGYEDIIQSKYNIDFELNKTKEENGTFIIESNGFTGNVKPNPNEGYEVDKVIVKDSEGNIIEAVKLQDGTYSFELYDDVSVEVLFKQIIENPKTGIRNITGILFTICLCFISVFLVLKNYNKSCEL